MFAREVAIKVHLPDVGVDECADFQVNDEQATQSPMEEHQIHPKPFVADPQSPLPPNKRKLVAEFQQKIFQMPDERVFQIALGVFIFQVKKFQKQRIADFFIGGNCVFRIGVSPLTQHTGFVFRQRRALVELRVDLPVQLSHRPASAHRFACRKIRAHTPIPHPQQPRRNASTAGESARQSRAIEPFNCRRLKISQSPIAEIGAGALDAEIPTLIGISGRGKVR